MRKEELIDNLVNTMRAREERICDMIKECERLRGLQHRDLIRVKEFELLKDIRDGKLLVLHADTKLPAQIALFHLDTEKEAA